MRRILLIAGLLACVAQAAEVYRWTDENGQIHFSDRPHPDAERIVIPETSTFTLPPMRQASPAEPVSEAEPEPAARYRTLSILKPTQEEVLWNTGGGPIDVQMRVQPRLLRSHQLQVFLDGARVEDVPTNSTNVQLPSVLRGVHTVTANVVDRSGEVLIESAPVTFAVRQTSILSPQNPNNPNIPTPGPIGPGPGGI